MIDFSLQSGRHTFYLHIVSSISRRIFFDQRNKVGAFPKSLFRITYIFLRQNSITVTINVIWTWEKVFSIFSKYFFSIYLEDHTLISMLEYMSNTNILRKKMKSLDNIDELLSEVLSQ